MRKLAFALAAATVLGVAAPASAQGLYVGVGDGGFGVGVSDYGPYGYWGGPYRHHYRTHHWGAPGYAYYGSPHYAYGYGYYRDGWGY